MIICPQPGGPPIYIVLADSAYEPVSDNSYAIENPDTLFPPSDESARIRPPLEKWRENKVIFAFSAEGEKLTPFGGWNGLDGYLFDLNGDGFIERIETQRYGTERDDETIEFLRVHRVEKKGVSLLSVALNRGRDQEFGWAINREPDGRYAILIGPKERTSPPPQRDGPGWRLKSVAATFRWNEERHRFDGPRGSAKEHFFLVDPDDDFGPALKMIRAAPPFPAQPLMANAKPPPKPAPTPAEQWHYVSLRGKADEELLAIMTAGKDENQAGRDAIVPTHLPEAFWELPPKEAALALVEENRSPENRRDCRIALDDRDGATPPAAGEIGYERRDTVHLITPGAARAVFEYKPHASRCSAAEVSFDRAGGGVPERRLVQGLKKEARSVHVPDVLARHVYETIWWLSRVRALCVADGSFTVSTGDSRLNFWMEPKVQPRIEVTLPNEAISARWSDGYNRETFANFAFLILRELITAKLKLVDPAVEPLQVGEPRKYPPDQDFVYNPKPPDMSDKAAIEAYVSRLLAIMRKEGPSVPPSFYVMSRLVPDEEPLRYADPRIDAALFEIAQVEEASEPLKAPARDAAWAAHALAQRDRTEAFDILMTILRNNSDSSIERALDGALLLVLKHPEFRERFRDYLAHALTHMGELMMSAPRLLDAVWVGGFTEFTPLLHELGTASIDEIASRRTSSYGGPPDPNVGRFHDARRLLTAWLEEDPLTQAKLFALHEVSTHRYIRVPSLVQPLYDKLPPNEKRAFQDFLVWYQEREEHNRPVWADRVQRIEELRAEIRKLP